MFAGWGVLGMFDTKSKSMSATLADLKGISHFEGISEAEQSWFLDHAELITLAVGEHLFDTGDATNHMYLMLSGKVQVILDYQGTMLPVATHERGQISGLLPYSNLKTAPGYGEALEESRVLRLHKEHFLELERMSPALVQRLVDLMKTRVREQEKRAQQRDKLEALGKLSAGLAHELNNPASAIKRMAAELGKELVNYPASLSELLASGAKPEDMQEVEALVKVLHEREPEALDTLARSEREDELMDWMDDHDVEDGFDLAPIFQEAGMTLDDLEAFGSGMDEGVRTALLKVMACQLQMQCMVADIDEAGGRISELVGSVKTYSHMDRANDRQKLNLPEGLNSTLVMLTHKLKRKNIKLKVSYDPDLGTVMGFPGELNQVWTNLIDNAVDAMEDDGMLQVRGYNSGDYVRVDIEDSGHGIPQDVLPNIFDPFFTTKDVGAGSGIGLDVVSRIVKMHQGTIEVDSKPGKTVFCVCLPKV